EFGNVWGYEGSTGDVDWSWDYHRAIDAFRRHPKLAGWLYTEHHDVINEWNGYWRFDRSRKDTGFESLVEGMTLRDLHAPLYLAGTMPNEPAVRVLGVRLEDAAATMLQRNFTTSVVEGELPSTATLTNGRRVRVARVAATAPSRRHWSLKEWTVLGDHKLD